MNVSWEAVAKVEIEIAECASADEAFRRPTLARTVTEALGGALACRAELLIAAVRYRESFGGTTVELRVLDHARDARDPALLRALVLLCEVEDLAELFFEGERVAAFGVPKIWEGHTLVLTEAGRVFIKTLQVEEGSTQ